MAILVKKAVLDDAMIPTPGFIKPIVEVPIAEPPPTRISVTIKRIFFLFELLYFFLYFSLSALRFFNIFS